MARDIKTENKRTKNIKDWPEPKPVNNIQIFLDFINFSKRFIKNFNKIAILLTLILWTTDESTRNESQSTRANDNENNQDALSGEGASSSSSNSSNIGRNIENLSMVEYLAKSKKIAKVNAFGAHFLTSEAKRVFVYL